MNVRNNKLFYNIGTSIIWSNISHVAFAMVTRHLRTAQDATVYAISTWNFSEISNLL